MKISHISEPFKFSPLKLVNEDITSCIILDIDIYSYKVFPLLFGIL